MSINLTKEKRLGDYVKDKRLHVFKMSQEDFAEHFNVSVSTLRNWEQNINQPPEHFITLIDTQEQMLREKYATPISITRRATDEEMNKYPEKAAFAQEARKNIAKDENQDAVYEIIKKMTDKKGIIDNLQTISPYFNNYNTTDISAVAALVMLQKISDSLDEIKEMIKSQ